MIYLKRFKPLMFLAVSAIFVCIAPTAFAEKIDGHIGTVIFDLSELVCDIVNKSSFCRLGFSIA